MNSMWKPEWETELKNAGTSLNLVLSEKAITQFKIFFEHLADWNTRISLTKVPIEETVSRHFIDSFSVFIGCEVSSGLSIVDIGTGPGFPGLPLKILYPELSLTLVESNEKKVSFLTSIVNKLELSDINIVSGRGEVLGHDPNFREKFDIATARALAQGGGLIELLLPFVKVGGKVIALKGAGSEEEYRHEVSIIKEIGGGDIKIIQCAQLGDLFRSTLLTIDKKSITPVRFPRSMKRIKKG